MRVLDKLTNIMTNNLTATFFEYNEHKHKRMRENEIRLWKKMKKESAK